jgi:hypothetical protein
LCIPFFNSRTGFHIFLKYPFFYLYQPKAQLKDNDVGHTARPAIHQEHIGHVHPAYNPYFLTCFFSRNSIFLLQQISQQCFSAGLSAQPNGAISFLIYMNRDHHEKNTDKQSLQLDIKYKYPLFWISHWPKINNKDRFLDCAQDTNI